MYNLNGIATLKRAEVAENGVEGDSIIFGIKRTAYDSILVHNSSGLSGKNFPLSAIRTLFAKFIFQKNQLPQAAQVFESQDI